MNFPKNIFDKEIIYVWLRAYVSSYQNLWDTINTFLPLAFAAKQ